MRSQRAERCLLSNLLNTRSEQLLGEQILHRRLPVRAAHWGRVYRGEEGGSVCRPGAFCSVVVVVVVFAFVAGRGDGFVASTFAVGGVGTC